jgi:hypothetical protein
MNRKDNSVNLDLFFSNTKKYDAVRNEDIIKTFPELQKLFEKYGQN